MESFLSNIDFDDLKYNLYELLNIKNNASYKKIRKSYKKLIIQFHPDKTSKLEEDIFHNISLAYQILKNEDIRYKYDLWLESKSKSKNINVLKNGYTNDKNKVKKYFPSESRLAFNEYNNLAKKKEKIHGVNNYNNNNIKSEYNKKIKKRSNLGNIEYKNYKDKYDFNNNFKDKKINYKDNIIKSNKNLVCFQKSEIDKKYISIDNYNKLYQNGSVIDESYTSLDLAFMLHPEIFLKDNENIREKVKKYKKQTKKLSILKFNLND